MAEFSEMVLFWGKKGRSFRSLLGVGMRWASRAGVVVVAVRTNTQASKTERPRIEQQETVPRPGTQSPWQLATTATRLTESDRQTKDPSSSTSCDGASATASPRLVRSCSSSSASDRTLLCRERGSRSRLNFSNQWLEVASRTQASNRRETDTNRRRSKLPRKKKGVGRRKG